MYIEEMKVWEVTDKCHAIYTKNPNVLNMPQFTEHTLYRVMKKVILQRRRKHS